MNDSTRLVKAISEFQRYKSRGRRLINKFLTPFYGNRRLLSLKKLTSIYMPEKETRLADCEVKVSRIIGSEDRSRDFAEGFMPIYSWMQKRWVKIWILMDRGELEEPVDLLEYGGRYFVRDGNHRVSVAKNQKREFIRARVTQLKVPFRLKKGFNRSCLESFKQLVKFQRKTGFLDNVPHAVFNIRRKQSWEILEKEINSWNPAWFERNTENMGIISKSGQRNHWYDWVYSYILNYIKKESLHYLYPGWGDADVALEMIRLWNSYPNPDAYTIDDMYEIFLKQTRRMRFFLAPSRFFWEQINSFRRSAMDERWFFLEMSNIREIRPEFRLPADLGKPFWRRLHKEVFKTHLKKMRKARGHSPVLHELIEDWYDNVWLPRTE